MAVAMIGPKFYAWDRNGKPLAFGKLYTYQARTNTPKPTYQSEDQVVENTNPIILNGEGYANVYLDGSYKMVLKDDKDNEIWSSDPVTSNQAEEWVSCVSAEYISPTSFRLIGNLTDSYEAGKKVRLDSNTTLYDYSTIESSSFAGGETTVTVRDPVVKTGLVGSCVSIVGENSSFNQTDLSLYSKIQFENVDGMKTLTSIGGLQVKVNIGDRLSTGGTSWVVDNGSVGVDLPDGLKAVPINKLFVTDFGAKGDGSTDDYESLQECFDLGFDVHFPRGEYVKDGTLNINSSKVKITADSAQLIESGAGKPSIVVSDGLADIHFDGLKIKGLADGKQANFGYGINFGVGCTDVSVSNCVLDGFNGGIFGANTSTRMRFEGNTFRNMFYVGTPSAGAHGYGILLEACRDTTTIGNIFEGTVQRHHLYYGTNAVDRTIRGYTHSIVGNVFLGLSLASYITGFEYLVKIMSNRNVTITGNTFRGGVGHVWMTESAPSEVPANISIVGNSFESVRQGDASDSSCIGSEFSTIRGVTISGNSFSDNDVRAHILLDSVISCIIQNNNINQALSGHGIEIQKPASDLTIHNNAMRITGSYRGIFINSDSNKTPSTDVSVRGNDINGGVFGIFFRYIPTAFIAENYIKNITDTAIYSFDDFSGVIKDNVINTVPTGINLRGPAGSKAKVYNNLIEGTTSRRIYAQDGVQLVKPFKDAVSNDTTQRFDSVEANSPPTTGAWNVGDEVRYRVPVAGGFVGAVCVTAGTPGTWKQFGAIQA